MTFSLKELIDRYDSMLLLLEFGPTSEQEKQEVIRKAKMTRERYKKEFEVATK